MAEHLVFPVVKLLCCLGIRRDAAPGIRTCLPTKERDRAITHSFTQADAHGGAQKVPLEPVPSQVEKLLEQRAHLDAELARQQRPITVLFVDLVGSTNYYEQRGDVAGIALVQQFVGLVTSLVREHDGHVVKTIGDAVLARFDRSESAARAALRMQSEITRRNTGLPPADHMSMRVALNFGPALFKGDDVFGDVVNVASRIEGAARPGEILMSPAVYEQIAPLEDIVVRKKTGSVALKGKAQRLELYEIVWLTDASIGLRPPRPSQPPQRQFLTFLARLGAAMRPGSVHWILMTVMLAGGFAVTWFATGRQQSGKTSGGISSLAVLPLSNYSDDPRQDYFVDGMTDAITSNNAQIGALRVISSTSVMHYRNTTKTVPEIAHELNVDAVIEGSVLRAMDHVRITVQLIDARRDRHLWAKDYEGDLHDVLALQNDVARAITSEIQAQVIMQERKQMGIPMTPTR